MSKDNISLDMTSVKDLYSAAFGDLPIADVSCHLSSKEIASGKKFSNASELLIYNSRRIQCTMRMCGVDEKYITGCGSDFEKFRELCRIMPTLFENTIHTSIHNVLRRYLSCDLILNPQNCEKIWEITSEALSLNEFNVADILKAENVSLLFTKENFGEDISSLSQIDCLIPNTTVLPLLSADSIISINQKGIENVIEKLEKSTSIKISDLDSLYSALTIQMDAFAKHGARAVYHNLSNFKAFSRPDKYHSNEIFKHAFFKDGDDISDAQMLTWQAQSLRFFGIECKKRNLALIIDLGDNVNTYALTSLFDYLSNENALNKVLLIPHTPIDLLITAELCGRYPQNDNRERSTVSCAIGEDFVGTELDIISSLIPLGRTVCSASCLSQEQYRLELCRMAINMSDGHCDQDSAEIIKMISNAAYFNTINYFAVDNAEK